MESQYIFINILVLIICVVLTPFVHFWMYGHRKDAFGQDHYNSVVLNQLADEIIKSKNILYNFKEFYSSSNIDFTKYGLLNHFLSLADIHCITDSSQPSLLSCSSLQINDVSVPFNIVIKNTEKFVCNTREYGSIDDTKSTISKVRILNHNYSVLRSCLNMTINKIEKLAEDKLLLKVKNDKAAYMFILLRPSYITTSMGYLYKVLYQNDPIYYGTETNNLRNYHSIKMELTILVTKVTNEKMYTTSLLFNLDEIKKYSNGGIQDDIQCKPIVFQESLPRLPSVSYAVQDGKMASDAETFNVPLTVYYNKLVEKTQSVSVDLTNAMSLYFKVDLSTYNEEALFSIARSALGKPDVCRTMSIKITNDSFRSMNITLNESPSLLYVFEFPKLSEASAFDVFVTYTLDCIMVYAAYTNDMMENHFKYQVFDTAVISSWSITDISHAIQRYKCEMPLGLNPASSFCIPSYMDVFSKMNLI